MQHALGTVIHPLMQALGTHVASHQDDLTPNFLVAHGAPVRLRAESQIGFKMVKWLQHIECVEEYASIREGQGGSRENDTYYEAAASI